MGKRARRAREKRVKKRKKRRVTFNRVVTTQVIPRSDPPRTERTRGGKGGAREQFAAAQRALGQEELNVLHQCGHTLEDVIRQVQANVTAELNYDAARKEQLALYPPVSVDAATEAARRARRLPTQQHEMRQVVDAQEPFILPSLPRRPGRCVCYCCRGGVYAGEAFCVHERCCRRWRRALPKIQDGFEDSGTDEDSGDDACLPCPFNPRGGAPAAEPVDAFDGPDNAGGADWMWDDGDGDGSGFDRNGFFDCDLADDDPIVLYYKGLSSSGAPATDSGTSRGTTDPALDDSDGSDDSDVDYSLWDLDAETKAFYDECGEDLEADYQWRRRKRAAR